MHGSKLKDQRTETVACFGSENHSISQSKTRPICVLGDPVQFCRSRPFVRTKTLQPGRHKQTQHGDWNLGAPESDNWPWGFLWDMKSGNMMLEKSRTEVPWLLMTFVLLNKAEFRNTSIALKSSISSDELFLVSWCVQDLGNPSKKSTSFINTHGSRWKDAPFEDLV
jgi:hypothetical protein